MNINQIIQPEPFCKDATFCVSARRLLAVILIIVSGSLNLFSQLKTAKLISTFDEKDKHYIDTVYCKEKYETTFILPKQRRIKQAVVGDPDEWEVLAKYGGTILSVKPLQEAEHTSLTIVTQSLKVYKFNIVNIKTVVNPGYDVIAIVEIREENRSMEVIKEAQTRKDVHQNDEPGPPLVGERVQEPVVQEESLTEPVLNPLDRSYTCKGSHIRIEKIYDDGVFTYIIMPKSQEFPAVFIAPKRRGRHKHLEPVKYVVKPGMIVVHRVLQKKEIILLRSGVKKDRNETLIYKKKIKKRSQR